MTQIKIAYRRNLIDKESGNIAGSYAVSYGEDRKDGMTDEELESYLNAKFRTMEKVVEANAPSLDYHMTQDAIDVTPRPVSQLPAPSSPNGASAGKWTNHGKPKISNPPSDKQLSTLRSIAQRQNLDDQTLAGIAGIPSLDQLDKHICRKLIGDLLNR